MIANHETRGPQPPKIRWSGQGNVGTVSRRASVLSFMIFSVKLLIDSKASCRADAEWNTDARIS